MKETFEPTVIWGDGMSSLHDWLKIANPEDCMELLKGVDRGDPDRILLLDDPDSNTAHWDIACGDYTPFCSDCGEEPPAYHMSAYCPNCGARMVTRERGGIEND